LDGRELRIRSLCPALTRISRLPRRTRGHFVSFAFSIAAPPPWALYTCDPVEISFLKRVNLAIWYKPPPVADTRVPTNDDVQFAFRSGSVLEANDDSLKAYLLVLCNETYLNDEDRLQAHNRCVTINALVAAHLTEKLDRIAMRYTALIVGVTFVGILVAIAQGLFPSRF
jgi:hypothetical protein